jgi:hypothetical protein
MITDWTLVVALIDRLIPADDFPPACQAGLADDLARDAVGFQEPVWTALLVPGFAALATEVGQRDASSFCDLDPDVHSIACGDNGRSHPRAVQDEQHRHVDLRARGESPLEAVVAEGCSDKPPLTRRFAPSLDG